MRSMSHISETPFDNIENSHQYVSMLAEAIEEARQEVDAVPSRPERRGAAPKRCKSSPTIWLSSRYISPPVANSERSAFLRRCCGGTRGAGERRNQSVTQRHGDPACLSRRSSTKQGPRWRRPLSCTLQGAGPLGITDGT